MIDQLIVISHLNDLDFQLVEHCPHGTSVWIDNQCSTIANAIEVSCRWYNNYPSHSVVGDVVFNIAGDVSFRILSPQALLRITPLTISIIRSQSLAAKQVINDAINNANQRTIAKIKSLIGGGLEFSPARADL